MPDKKIRSGEAAIVRKQAEEARRESETRFRHISAITSDIAYSCHAEENGRFSIDWMTGAADRITGYSIEEIKAQGCWRFLVVEEDIALFEKNVIGLAPGSHGSCELRIRHKNGGVVWISSFAECVSEPRIPGRLVLYGGLTDITERKQVEEKLSASETRYRRLFEAAKDGILILDADTGMIIDVNPFLTEMLGFSREEFLGKHIWDLGFFKGIVAKQADFLELQQKEYIRYEDLPLETADGRRINVEFVSNLYQVGPGRVIQCSVRGAHLASFPAQNPYPVVEVGTDGVVRFANAAAMATLARLGLDPDAREFLPGTPEELVLLRSQCERNPQTQELRVGKALFLRVVAAPPAGDSLHVYALDITERKQAEEETLRERALFDRLVETAPEGIAISDAQGRVMRVNAEFVRMFGYGVDELVGQRIDDLVAPPAFQEEARAITRSTRRGEETLLETVRCRKDGTLVDVSLIVAPILIAGKLEAGYGIYRDITERKRAQDKLQIAQLQWSQFLEVSPDPMWIKDASGRYVAASKSYFHVDPSAEGNIIGKTDAECFPPEKAVVYVADDRVAIETGASEGEFTAVGDDGKLRTFLTKKVVLRAPDGSVAGTLGVSRDVTDRKQAEEALRESKERYRTLIQSVGEGIGFVDPEEQFAFANAAAEDIFGMPPGGLLGHSLREFTKAEQFGMIREQTDRRRAGEKGVYEIEINRPTGEKRNLLITAVPQSDSQGKFLGALGVFRDITDRKQAEEALLQARDDWESTFDSLTDAVTIHDKNYDIIRANSSARRMLGLPLLGNLITNAKCFMCYHGTEKPPEGCPSCRSLVTEQPCSFELFEPHLNRYLEIRAIPRFDTHHQCIGLVHVVRDITERKRVEEALKESEDRFRAVFEQAAVGVALLNTRTGQFVRVNQKYCDLVGYTMQEMLQKSLMDITFDQDIQENVDNNAQLMEGKSKELSFEKRYVHKDGHLVWGNLTISPLWKPGEKPQTYFHIAIVENITERKQAEAQLRQSQKMGAIGQLAGGVAHDFNNLLTGILGNIALMRSSLPAADPLLENLNAAETAARQAADLTKGLLTFSRSAMILPVPMNITAALDATLVLLKQSLPATMEIVRDYEQTAWNVLLDQSQLTQILLNLAVNARDAMKGKGTLTIRARNEVVDAAYVHEHPYARTGEFVHLSVSDTGSGMSSEVMQHLFEPFYTTKPVGSGTGLGLSIVYGAVKQAGGWITGASTEGVGTTFDIYLPRCLEEPTESFAPSPPSLNARGGTVLVVEDEPVVRAVAQALLTRSGYMVLTAPDGASALSVLQDHPVGIGLILLDMTMPGMTNGEVVQAIRALDPTVPILLNSGYTSNGTVKQMLEENSVQGFLSKPYDLDQLLENVQRLLHRG
jgi:PAS domain S-box-containing protein